MNLYAIRDRMVDYFMVPFPAPDHSQVKAAVAVRVNAGDSDAISQAPHHFEIHQLATLDTETGKITEAREFVCDCSSLIRRNLRGGSQQGPDNGETGKPSPDSPHIRSFTPPGTRADEGTDTNPA